MKAENALPAWHRVTAPESKGARRAQLCASHWVQGSPPPRRRLFPMAEVQTASDGKPRFSRILLKLSGEALAPAQGSGLDLDALAEIALEIKEVAALGVQLAMVIGAGNYIRGSDYEARGMDRSTADQMGMLATVINALALQNALEHVGVVTRVLSAIEM